MTSCSTSPKDWFAYQLDRPDLGGGLMLAFRRAQCVAAAQTFFLHGLDPAARYEVTNLDAGGPTTIISGRDLMAKGIIPAENMSEWTRRPCASTSGQRR